MSELNILSDDRLDPRIKAYLQRIPPQPTHNVASREELLEYANAPEQRMMYEAIAQSMELVDYEKIAPSEGLRVSKEVITSDPDGNTISLQIIRPDNEEVLPCIYFTHGGSMQLMSCFMGCYRALGKIIASKGVAVVMVDFRNAIIASTAPEVAPYPAGLNDCVSGFRWTHANAERLCIDPSRIIIAGESGGGNLAIATALKLKKTGDISLVKGIYAFCPYLAGDWSKSKDNSNWLYVANNRGAIAYGIEAFKNGDPLAWPGFAVVDDVAGLPPVKILVNECDPLREDGINFYRLLLKAGVKAYCQESLGTCHSAEFLIQLVPELTHAAARSLADFATLPFY